ncbi:hypothetical protein [Alienimonas chondri]|uniref:Uncharacterized protein n=1 Tax=Alienimonas chondri TaxID=2681879 RepID=A0ABX1V8G9_9PLAN|nr:hypothetical protein [Alienimonas chondri]NNJ24444.1 hypothetical protein [Alienimonas chondri]
MSEPNPAPESAAPSASAQKGVSPVVWIGLAAVIIAGGVYAYAVFVPPEMPKDGPVEQVDGESAGDEGANQMPGDPVDPAAPAPGEDAPGEEAPEEDASDDAEGLEDGTLPDETLEDDSEGETGEVD